MSHPASFSPAPTFGSLFCGVGGFDLGFEAAGFRCAWQVEIDKAAAGVLAHHWPDVPRWADVVAFADWLETLTPAELEPLLVDVVTYGFPCQDLSVAGKRAGFEGQRSSLFYHAARIIRTIRPSFAIAENVPGLLSSAAGGDFARVLGTLAELGQSVAWATLDAQWRGVAQRRERVFIVVDLGGECAGEILALSEGLQGHPAPRRETREDVAGSLGASLGGCDENDAEQRRLIPEVAGCLQERDSKGCDSDTKPGHLIPVRSSGRGYWTADDTAATLGTEARAVHESTLAFAIQGAATRENPASGPDGLGVRSDGAAYTLEARAEVQCVAFDTTQITSPANRSNPQPGAPCQQHPPTVAFNARQDPDSLEQRTGPLDTDGGTQAVAFSCKDHGADAGDMSPTLRSMGHAGSHPNGGGQVAAAYGMTVRRLTPTECERLMGWPDGHTARRVPLKLDGNRWVWANQAVRQKDGPRYKQCGNGVVASVARYIAERCADAITIAAERKVAADKIRAHRTRAAATKQKPTAKATKAAFQQFAGDLIGKSEGGTKKLVRQDQLANAEVGG